jgi:hypothetical protein
MNSLAALLLREGAAAFQLHLPGHHDQKSHGGENTPRAPQLGTPAAKASGSTGIPQEKITRVIYEKSPQKQEAYWKELLKDYGPALVLPAVFAVAFGEASLPVSVRSKVGTILTPGVRLTRGQVWRWLSNRGADPGGTLGKSVTKPSASTSRTKVPSASVFRRSAKKSQAQPTKSSSQSAETGPLPVGKKSQRRSTASGGGRAVSNQQMVNDLTKYLDRQSRRSKTRWTVTNAPYQKPNSPWWYVDALDNQKHPMQLIYMKNGKTFAWRKIPGS